MSLPRNGSSDSSHPIAAAGDVAATRSSPSNSPALPNSLALPPPASPSPCCCPPSSPSSTPTGLRTIFPYFSVAAALHLSRPRPRPQPQPASHFLFENSQKLEISRPPASRLSRPPLFAHYFPLPRALPPLPPTIVCPPSSLSPTPAGLHTKFLPASLSHHLPPSSSSPSPSAAAVYPPAISLSRLSHSLSLPPSRPYPSPSPTPAATFFLLSLPSSRLLPSSRAFQCVLSVDDAGPAQRHLSPPPAAFPLPPSLFPLPPARCPPARASPFLFSKDDASRPRGISLANTRCADVISSTDAQRP